MSTRTSIDVTELAELIAGYYREALSDESLDTFSDFFESGGDSLAAFQIVDRLQHFVGAELAVALVFAYPSPAELAQVVVDDLAAADTAVAV